MKGGLPIFIPPVDIDEAVRGAGPVAELHRLPVFSASRVVNGAGGKERPAVEGRRTVTVQPLRERFRIASRHLPDGRHDRPRSRPCPGRRIARRPGGRDPVRFHSADGMGGAWRPGPFQI